jgi:hypothetical protein
MGLLAVEIGGTVVLKLSKLESVRTARLLYMLDVISGSLSTCKPRSMHATRGTFYAIAKDIGFGSDPFRLPMIVDSLRRLWFELTYSGSDGSGRGLIQSDLDFIISADELAKGYLFRLIELGRTVWMTQASALHGFLRMKGIDVNDVVLPWGRS